MNCRHCETPLTQTFLDLGFAPPSNSYLSFDDLSRPETYYPLKIKVCDFCWLVQTEDYAQADELFSSDYAYFSSTSTSWLEHASQYARKVINDLDLNTNSHVVEIGSNDGYLLKNFVTAGIPCLGIEPTDSTAAAAEKIGIQARREFFSEALGKQLTAEGKQSDLIIGNNVYAHVPDINNFTRGLKAALKQEGAITLEFPHLMQLIQQVQFDTIYHEHFSYLSLYTVSKIFLAAGLRIWDVEQISTHGGSLRVYGCHIEDKRTTKPNVQKLLDEEAQLGLQSLHTYQKFQSKAEAVKNDFIAFLINQKQAGKKVVAYGAAAKGNTLLNYAGIKPDLLPFVYDAAVSKQHKFMPGSHIPIRPPEELAEQSPDFVVILPWNLKEEIVGQFSKMHSWSGRFAIAIPQLEIIG